MFEKDLQSVSDVLGFTSPRKVSVTFPRQRRQQCTVGVASQSEGKDSWRHTALLSVSLIQHLDDLLQTPGPERGIHIGDQDDAPLTHGKAGSHFHGLRKRLSQVSA